MKNKKETALQNRFAARKVDSEIVKTHSEFRSKNKTSASQTFLQKSTQILQTYNALFKKPLHHLGDADTYFKQSLRNYNDFDLLKNSKWDINLIRPAKSLDSVKADKKKTAASTRKGDGDKLRDKPDPQRHLQQNDRQENEHFNDSKQILDEEADLDDVFYSPSSEPLALDDIKEVEEAENTKMEGEEDVETAIVDENEEENDEDLGEETDHTVDEDEDVEDDGEDDLQEIGEMVDAAVTDLEEVSEQAPEIEETIGSFKEAVESMHGSKGGPEGSTTGSVVPYDPADAAVLKELEEAEREAKETAKIVNELKQRVGQLLKKEKMTDTEAKELEEKNRQLKEHMKRFEEKTKRIQMLLERAQSREAGGDQGGREGPPPRKHKEDMLPKVIICGVTENNMPKIIVCNDKKKSSRGRSPGDAACAPEFAKKLNESYCMQERLAAENADLESMRYQLQSDVINKDQTVESLQRKLNGLQAEMRMIIKENLALSEKLERIQNNPAPCNRGDSSGGQTPRSNTSKQQKMPCGKGKGPCPADVETRLQEYSETTQQLERQLGDMENEVRNMQQELEAVQKERQHLEHHRRMLCPPPQPQQSCPPPPPKGISSDTALKELREQYTRLQDDYKAKLTEVAGLRADNEKFKQNAKDAEEGKKTAEEKLKEAEKELKQYRHEKNKFTGSKEQLVEQEQQLNVAKQRFREAQDELEELRALIQDQQAQLDDYRNKYLQAQQQVEEQRRQIDMMEMENNRIAEQVNLEIQRVKNQFQEKLQELTPLPDILKATQIKLQEAQQMHLIAERNNEALVRELQAFRDRAAEMANQLEKERSDQLLGQDQKASLQSRMEESERKCSELQEENDSLREELERVEGICEENEKRVQEKLHEIAQLMAQLETVREESARQVARTKDRCETVRRSMQCQIADLEKQVAQSRAQAKAAQRDRDEIRQKMQAQINNLNENFEDAQMRIRNLQGHVNFLKNSYTNVFPPDGNAGMMPGDGLDPCDCGNNF